MSNKEKEVKKLAYMIAIKSFWDDSNVLMMSSNLITKDLQSNQSDIQFMALLFLTQNYNHDYFH